MTDIDNYSRLKIEIFHYRKYKVLWCARCVNTYRPIVRLDGELLETYCWSYVSTIEGIERDV